MTRQWHKKWTPPDFQQDNPFIGNAFLNALEDSGVCTPQTGWAPQHLAIDTRIQVPAYIKNHSWGEFVFDWAWAHAYEKYGMDYYPKLVIASPYTPSQGPRLLGVQSDNDTNEVIYALKDKCYDSDLSGFHILFPSPTEQHWLDNQNLLKRSDIQFHWKNEQYRDFEDFLDRFASRKRKNVRKERQSIHDQGIDVRALTGDEITDTYWQAFYQFYHANYLKRGRQGYLNYDFFTKIRQSMRDQIVLMIATINEAPIAAALCFKDNQTLYGRYWGCRDEYNNLHFEVCYYQGIHYCIENGLKAFDPGTQGEHKISRGFEPTYTHSYHWLQNTQFFEAANNFCLQEQKLNAQYLLDAQKALPFKQIQES